MSPSPGALFPVPTVFPDIRTIVATTGSTATTTAVVNLPQTNYNPGEIWIVLHRCAAGLPSLPGGFFELVRDSSDASDDGTMLMWRQTGNGEASTVSITQPSGKFASLAFAITGGQSSGTATPSVSSSLAVGTTTTPTPTSTGGPPNAGSAVPTLILWCGGWSGTQTSPPTGNPTGYTLANSRQGADSGSGGAAASNCRVATAARTATIVTETGQSWTISASTAGWTAFLCFISPTPIAQPGIVNTAVSRASVWSKKLGRRWVRDRHGLLVPEYA